VALLEDRERGILNEVTALNGRFNSGRPSASEIVAEANRLAVAYGDLARSREASGASDYAIQRQIATMAFAWLARAGALYSADPTVAQALMQTYSVMGSFFSGARVYAPGPVLAWSGANRIARALVLNPETGGRFENELKRYGLAWAAATYVAGGVPPPEPETSALPFFGDPPESAAEGPLPLPTIDESTLSPVEKPLLEEVRRRFPITAKHVLEARLALEQLAQRLQQQNLKLNNQDAAAALMMRGFLEDAAGLVRAGQLQRALEALTRADYQRASLKNVTGQ